MRTVHIIAHFPEEREGQRALEKKVAAVHGQTVMEKVKAMGCPMDQKAALMDAVKACILKEDGP